MREAMSKTLTVTCLCLVGLYSAVAPGAKAEQPVLVERILGDGRTAQFDLSPLRYADPRPTLREVDQIAETIQSVNETYSPVLSMPKSINVRLLKKIRVDSDLLSGAFGEIFSVPRASFRWESGTINVGISLETIDKNVQSPQRSLPATVHEYGHAIFSENLERVMPDFHEVGDLLRLHHRYSRQIKAFPGGDRLDGFCPIFLANGTGGNKTNEAINANCPEFREIVLKQKALVDRISAQKWISKMTPYHELFADVIAVLESGNKEAMGDALAFIRSPIRDPRSLDLRSFTNCPAASEATETKPHGYFSPVRCEIGKFIKSTMTKVEKAQLASKVFDVLAADLKRAISSKTMPDPVEDNTRLIHELQQALGNETVATTDGNNRTSKRSLNKSVQ